MVGVCLQRSTNLLVALLAILKAGAAYVPLDPSYPKDRLAFMLQDAHAALVLTDPSSEGALPNDGARRWLLNDSLPSDPARVLSAATPQSLAYVIYTSGSTGRPKGVAVTSRSVVNLLASLQKRTGFSPSDVLLAVTSLSFDIAGLELFMPLLTGATVVVADRDATLDGQALRQLIATLGVTFMQATPSTWRLLLDAGLPEHAALHALCGGEALPLPLAARLRNATRAAWNVYGPTETTIWSAAWCIPELPSAIAIGTPLDNQQLYILDDRMQAVPVGVRGELFIGGDGLARGYLRRPDLTAERFLPSPFAYGARLYRTGDVARWLPDGTVEFLRRVDHQVKVRGFRIELGEVEVALLALPAIAESVVVVHQDPDGVATLVAYVTRKPDAPDLPDLRAVLQRQLPAYMVPSLFIVLDKLPLTPNGKVDRKALPAPDHAAAVTADFVPPRNPIEGLIAGIWTELLKLPRVGAYDDFFALGGHSLLAVQVVARLRKLLSVELSRTGALRVPHAAPGSPNTSRARLPTPAVPHPPWCASTGPASFPCRSPRLACGFSSNTSPARQAMSFSPSGGSWDRSTWRPLAARSETLSPATSRYAPSIHVALEPEPCRVIDEAFAAIVLLPSSLEDCEAAHREARARLWLAEQARVPFDLATGHPFRAALLRLDVHDHILVLAIHHIVSDAWSVGVLQRELVALYVAHTQKRDPKLPALPIQYADYAAWERSDLQRARIDRQFDDWKQHLQGVPALEMPTDRPRPPMMSTQGARFDFTLDSALSAALQVLARQQGSTLFMVLLSGFASLLSRHNGQSDFAIGTPVAHRTQLETEGLVGFFVNTLALRVDLQKQPSVRQLLDRVREEDPLRPSPIRTSLSESDSSEHFPTERYAAALPSFRPCLSSKTRPSMPSRSEMRRCKLSAFDPGISRQFDLTLSAFERNGKLAASFEYATALFDHDTIVRWAGHLERLLRAMVDQPDGAVHALPMLADEERHFLVKECNATAIDYPRAHTLHALFEEQVARTPEATAVVFEGARLSYRELNERANRLAHGLRALGVGPEVLVGICLHRSLDLIVALLGVLKSEGAYVPLDPTYPEERLRMMLDDSSAPVLLTEGKIRESLPAPGPGIRVFDVSDPAWSKYDSSDPERHLHEDNLVYTIFTSGSTGRPKGAQNTHRGVFNRLMWMQQAFQLDASDAVLQKTPMSFDVFPVWEFFWPLMFGARLVVAVPEGHRDPAYLMKLIRILNASRHCTSYRRCSVSFWKSSSLAVVRRCVD